VGVQDFQQVGVQDFPGFFSGVFDRDGRFLEMGKSNIFKGL
jgi:hypothetical protein